MNRVRTYFVATLCLAVASPLPLCAAEIVLRNGGRLRGDVRRSKNDAAYIIQLSTGSRIKVHERKIRKIIDDSPELKRYSEFLRDMPDTAAGHWTMATWCKENSLKSQALFHQQLVLRHDPNHADARRALGYSMLNGRWTKPEEFMAQQGYKRYKGEWKLPQQIELLERQREIELAQKKWRRDLKLWRTWLEGRRVGEAREQIKRIKDPAAVPGLGEMIQRESSPEVREMYVDVLGRIGNSGSVSILIGTALNDSDLEVRIRAIDSLREVGRAPAVQAFSGALRSKDNRVVRRAGVALGRLRDPDAILPLIDALVTRHETIVQPTSALNPSFSQNADGSGGMSGLNLGGGPKRIVRDRKNQSVLEALISLTKQNYQFSKTDWKNWYIRQHEPGEVNLRRDF